MPADSNITTKVVPTVEGGNPPSNKPDLNSAFDNFFSQAEPPTPEEAAEAQAAPEPPPAVVEPVVTDVPGQEDEPAPEPEATQPAPKPDYKGSPDKKEKADAKPEDKPAETPKVPAKAEIKDDPEDPELAKYQPDSNAKPRFRQDFLHLKKLVGTYKKEAQGVKASEAALREEVKRRDAELDAARKAVESKEIPEAIQKQLAAADARAKDAEARVRLLDLKNDKEFQSQYKDPIQKLHADLLDECVKAAPGDEAIQKWAEQKKKENPDDFDERWWETGVLSHPIFEAQKLARGRVERKVSELTALKTARDEKLKEFEANPDRLGQYEREKREAYWGKFYIPAATDEAQKISVTMGEWATPKDVSKAANADERKAFEAHNEVYKRFEDDFRANLARINDDSEDKPRIHVRVALQATKALKMEQERDEAMKALAEKEAATTAKDEELKNKQEQLDALQAQLDKLTAVRSAPARASHVPSKNGQKPAGDHRLTQSTRDAWAELMGDK